MSISLQICHLIHASIQTSMKIFTTKALFFIQFNANVRDMPKYIQVLNKRIWTTALIELMQI